MEEKERNPFVDELLDASLANYRNVTPRAGLERRLLVGLQEARRRRRWLAWGAALATGAAGVLLLVHALRVQPPLEPRRAVSTPVRESAQPTAPVTAANRPAALRQAVETTRKARPKVPVREVLHRPEQFPTPVPLTEQEKLLLLYVREAPRSMLTAETDQQPMENLKIEPLKITPLEIKPLAELHN
jgi:hypothetical protein